LTSFLTPTKTTTTDSCRKQPPPSGQTPTSSSSFDEVTPWLSNLYYDMPSFTATTFNQFAAQSRLGINSPCPLFPAWVFRFHGFEDTTSRLATNQPPTVVALGLRHASAAPFFLLCNCN